MIKVIKDLVDVYEFMEGAVLRPDDVTQALADGVLLVSNGEEGTKEVQAYFRDTVKAGETHAMIQLSETPVAETGDQVELVQVRGNVILAHKIEETKVTNLVRIERSNEVWKKALKLMGRIKEAGDYYASRTDEADAYDCMIVADKLLQPVGRLVNATVVGWYFEFEAEFAVNGMMYGG